MAATANAAPAKSGFGYDYKLPFVVGASAGGVEALVDLAAFLGGTRPRTTLNIDGRAASHNELVFGAAPLWDVAQVEIFRSPQSTTEGRNSIAGAIYVRTRSPTFEWPKM